MSLQPRLVEPARTIVEVAERQDVCTRLLGGIAVWLRATERLQGRLARAYDDVDLATRGRHARRLRDVLEELGYVPDRTFNATHGARRLLYYAGDGSFHIDIFIDEFAMSHKLNLVNRLDLEPLTLPAAELLATKLQVAETNRKDISDALMILLSHELGHEDRVGILNVDYLARLCARDWGLYTSLQDNLEKVSVLADEFLPEEADKLRAQHTVAELSQWLHKEPKSRAWKLRDRVGRRVRWYEIPEEIGR